MASVLLLVASAFATPYSADIELVNPTFESGSVPGAADSFVGRRGTVRVGALLQYTLDPLVYREGDTEIGAAVGNRFTTDIGLSWQIARIFVAHAFLPVVGQWGAGEVSDAAPAGLGTGDIGVGAKLALLHGKQVGLSLNGDLRLPNGRRDAWLGERGVRGSFGPGFSVSAGPIDVLTGIQIAGRSAIVTPDDFNLGSEVAADAAVRLNLIEDRFSLHLASVGRLGIGKDTGVGEMPLEAMLGAAVWPVDSLQIDIGVGHGLSAGYGSTRFRALAGLTYVHRPPRQEEDTEVDLHRDVNPDGMYELVDADDDPVMDKIPETVDAPPEAPAAPQWEKGELARVEKTQIIIRDPIKFDKSTAEIVPASKPLLSAIAQRLLEHPEILQVIIEGHSSEEGDFAYNYELSMTRAVLVYKALIEAGVDAQRLAVRALGEVVPSGTDAAENRRVVFQIVTTAQAGDPKPATQPTPVPWTGEKAK